MGTHWPGRLGLVWRHTLKPLSVFPDVPLVGLHPAKFSLGVPTFGKSPGPTGFVNTDQGPWLPWWGLAFGPWSHINPPSDAGLATRSGHMLQCPEFVTKESHQGKT